MKQRVQIALMALLALGACNNTTSKNEQDQYTPPPANTVIAQQSEAIKEDTLNHFLFTVRLVATPYSSNGTYIVTASYGPNNAENQFTMPRGGEHLKPVLRKLAAPYTCMIGFYFGKDTTFYDYYLVSGNRGQIEMKYVKAYSFQ